MNRSFSRKKRPLIRFILKKERFVDTLYRKEYNLLKVSLTSADKGASVLTDKGE
jgi:hypothetical protein